MIRYIKKHKFKTIIIIVALFLLFYYSSGYFFIFNNNSYVDAPVIQVTPTVSGRIKHVFISDNSHVKKGEKLFLIEQRPFNLEVNYRKIAFNKAKKKLVQQSVVIATLQSKVKSTKVTLDNITLRLKQEKRLLKESVISNTRFNQLSTEHKIVLAEYDRTQETLGNAVAENDILSDELKMSHNALMRAEWELSQTVFYAPASGYVNHLRISEGDYATKGSPLFGLVNLDNWYITANIKENNLPLVKKGKKLWVYLSNNPWHLYHGEIDGITHGIARESYDSQREALPYIKPVTSWIRYPYRIPVKIKLTGMPQNIRVLRGVDAKVVIF